MQLGAVMTDNSRVGAERLIIDKEDSAGAGTAVGLCVGIIVVIALVDFFTANVNLSILYVLPVLLLSQTRRKLAAQGVVLAAVVLTYLGYFLGPRPQGNDGVPLSLSHMLTDWRMFNRSLCAVALCGITGIASLETRFHLALERRRSELEATDSDARIYEEILQSFKELTGVIASVVIVSVVAIADFITPAQYNLPILYGVPLVICAMTRRRALLWSVLPVLLVITYAGYVIGPTTTDISGHIGIQAGLRQPAVVFGDSAMRALPSLLTNRTLAAVAMLFSTLLLHWWMRPRRSTTASAAHGVTRTAHAA